MTVTDLLDAAKKAQGFTTDMALAQALGISRSAVSAWRNGVKTPDTVQCAALAGYTGLPLAQVLGIVGEARAISREEKAVWRKLAGSVALLLCAIGFSGAMPGKAYAISLSASETPGVLPINAYYVKGDWGWWAWLARQWLAWRLRGSKPTNGSLDACQIA